MSYGFLTHLLGKSLGAGRPLLRENLKVPFPMVPTNLVSRREMLGGVTAMAAGLAATGSSRRTPGMGTVKLRQTFSNRKSLMRKITGMAFLILYLCQAPVWAQARVGSSIGTRDAWCITTAVLAALNVPEPPLHTSPEFHSGLSMDSPNFNPLHIPPESDSNSSPFNPVQPITPRHSSTKVRWKPAFQEALLYTGIMHTFNLWTEAGTRDTLNGHWFRNYVDSVSELRGWSDSDKFMAPYVGHPLEGSIFGFILRQNDPKYRYVQWGDGRDYFVSLLRSMAFSAVWHTQWKIGPISEASIGNVMLHASPGFITLVDTPTLGAVTMIAEDAADRYWLMGLENRTANRTIIILARCFLNPGRTFANLMAFQVPWRRDTRLGLFSDYELRKELVQAYREGSGEKPFVFVRRPTDSDSVEFGHTYPKEASIELSAYPYFESFLGGGNCVGGGGSGATRVNPALQVVAEVDGCLVMGMPQSNQSGDSLFYGAGPRWTPLASHRFSPYVQFLFGGRKVTYEVDNIALHKELLKEWDNGDGTLPHYPTRSDWSVEAATNGPSIAVGGGLDVVVSRPFAWRVVNVEYTHSWMPSVDMIHPQNGVRITTEAVLRIGTW